MVVVVVVVVFVLEVAVRRRRTIGMPEQGRTTRLLPASLPTVSALRRPPPAALSVRPSSRSLEFLGPGSRR
jgi:hypothetical protein